MAQESDPAAIATRTETEESKKVERAKGEKHFCCFRRKSDAEIMAQPWPRFAAAEEEEGGEENA